jgi:RNA methyltransferase, TrmH family
MLSTSKLKWIVSLGQKKVRRQQGVFIAEGEKIVDELISSQWPINEIFALNSWQAPPRTPSSIPITRISPKELERISQLTTPNQVLAVVQTPNDSQAEILFQDSFTLLLENIQDPGNMGTILRTADWFGIHNIIITPDSVDIFSPKVIQASMGSFIRVTPVSMAAENFLQMLPEGFPVMGAVLEGTSLFQVTLPRQGVLIIGNESRGISGPLQSMLTHRLYIPRGNEKQSLPESLNASVAAAIIMAQLALAPH